MVRVTGSRVLVPFVIVVFLTRAQVWAKKDAFKREISKCFMDATERERKKERT